MNWLKNDVDGTQGYARQNRTFFAALFVFFVIIAFAAVPLFVAQNGAKSTHLNNDSIIDAHLQHSPSYDYCDTITLSDVQPINSTKNKVLAVDNYHDIEEMVLKIAKEDIYVKLWRVDEKSNDRWYIVYSVGRYDYLRTINVKKGVYDKMTRVVFENNGWFHVAGDKRKRYEMDMDTLRYYYRNELKASFPTSVVVHIPQPDFTRDEFEEYQEMIDVENCRDEYDEFESYDSYEDYLEDGGFE